MVIREGHGARVWDEDGNEYVDYMIGSGPMLLGHDHPEVLDAIKSQLGKGLTFFATNSRGIELAEEICAALPCAAQLRYVSTGSEADMYAIRLSRAYTGRNKVLKFEGGYHGMSDESLTSLSPTELRDFPAAVPDSAGIPENVRENVLVAPFNDSDYAINVITEHADDLACVIVEPLQRIIPGRTRGILPSRHWAALSRTMSRNTSSRFSRPACSTNSRGVPDRSIRPAFMIITWVHMRSTSAMLCDAMNMVAFSRT